MDYSAHTVTGTIERLVYRGIRMKAKKEGKCFISGKPISIGDEIVWLPKTPIAALRDQVDAAEERARQEDEDLRFMGYL